MEQIQFIKEKLQIRDFPKIRTKQYEKIQAPQIIFISFIVTFVFNLFGVYTMTYLVLGFILPLICRYKDIKIFNYWQCFALLLFYRTFSNMFQTLDGLLLILLWHPNFKYGLRFIEWIKSFKQKGYIGDGINHLKKIL